MSRLTLAAALAAALLSPAAWGADVTATEAWARATTSQARNGGAFLTLSNPGTAPDRLVAAAAPDVAEKVELHTHLMEGGVARMRPVEGGIEVPAGGSVVLKPGGYHVMLMGLKRPLKPGESFPLALTLEKAGTLPVTVQVWAPGQEPAAHAGHNHAHKGGQGAGTTGR
ncbi:copper chaperone PCu(A)C [Aerophototrophica crusticola]|uniref:Copper chaperone PCu(A)C n=1 Tax=Aerophototrophica crusticola TaxID=1709002 RepID=A0A858R3P8_9PROT|nr:copper chaperone PCu(A)C [Rhodospirillaceae bacterium B3]